MIDMEQTVLDLLKKKVPDVKWSVGYPQAVKKIGTGVGSITQMDNSVHTTTNEAVDRISSVGVQIQVWAETPERRNALDEEIDTAMQEIGITRSGLSHFAEARGDESLLFRSALMYSGAYDNKTKQFYVR